MFSDVPYDLVESAVKDYIQNVDSPYAPTPGQIRARLDSVKNALRTTKYEAWDIVRNGLGKADKRRYFDDLPRDIQLAVGSYQNFVDLSLTPHDQLQYRRSNFYSRYDEIVERRETVERTSPEVFKYFGRDKEQVLRFETPEIGGSEQKQLTGHVQTKIEKTLEELRDEKFKNFDRSKSKFWRIHEQRKREEIEF